MDRSDVQIWLNRYVEAWREHDADAISALFSEDAVYRYRPYGEDAVRRGRPAIVAGWLDQVDPPGSWEASYEPYAVDGDRAVATGRSRYAANERDPSRTYHNVFLLRFTANGRCAEFTEVYMVEDRRERVPPDGLEC